MADCCNGKVIAFCEMGRKKMQESILHELNFRETLISFGRILLVFVVNADKQRNIHVRFSTSLKTYCLNCRKQKNYALQCVLLMENTLVRWYYLAKS